MPDVQRGINKNSAIMEGKQEPNIQLEYGLVNSLRVDVEWPGISNIKERSGEISQEVREVTNSG